ncbi:hypothetical protein MTES_2699 [Microbacterium testaceum StLB037]|uniref:DUF916 domain-containing protein n=1 Tax=Microbacterium testaceum (strain StLB037) TaxID=979556 RepID=E8N8K7_MICTS|nr:DUF916 domain-containing protein [Microbacterium testaceum]BAJ75663.1 hypothetical protein MTES_2699 [Microbacterium testaceum StLB037]
MTMDARISRWPLIGVAVLAFAASVIAAPMLAAPMARAEDATPDITWSVTPAGESAPDDRGIIEQDLDPGASAVDHFAVRNFSTDTVTFRLTAADGFHTPSGRFDMLPTSQQSKDAGTWISLPEQVTVPANETAIVAFTTTVPADAQPGDHSAGIAASVLSSGTQGDAQVAVDSRVGFRVTTRVSGELSAAVHIENPSGSYDLSWNPFQPGTLRATFDVVNDGNTMVVAGGTVTGGFEAQDFPTGDDGKVTIFPGERRSFSVDLPSAWVLFWAPLTVDFTGSAADDQGRGVPMNSVSAQTTVFSVPWPQLTALAGIALVVASAAVGRRRSRSRLDAMLRAAREEGRRAAAMGDEHPLRLRRTRNTRRFP